MPSTPDRRIDVWEGARDQVVSGLDVETAAGIVTSVVTTRSIDTLELDLGAPVLAVFKSTEVLLAKL